MDNNYQKALNYYRNHSDANTIRKIQVFLAARNYYTGDLDGKFGPQTYAAIKAYQKAVGTKEDGMWGESTNSFHRVLNATNAPYRNDASGTSGAHTSFVQGVHGPQRNAHQWTYNEIQEVYNKVVSDDSYAKWFWGDDSRASQIREMLYSMPNGAALMDEIYANTSDAVKKGISTKKLSNNANLNNMVKGMHEGTDKAAKVIAGVGTGLAALPAIVASPIATGLAVAGGAAGSRLAGNLNDNLLAGDSKGYSISNGLTADVPAVMLAADYYRPAAQTIGGAVGSIVGAGIGTQAKLPSMTEIRDNAWAGTKRVPTHWKQDAYNENGTYTLSDGAGRRVSKPFENKGHFSGGRDWEAQGRQALGNLPGLKQGGILKRK